MNLIEIGQVVIEIQRVESGKLVVPENNTLVHHTAFLTVWHTNVLFTGTANMPFSTLYNT